MYVIKTNDLHQRINNGVNYKNIKHMVHNFSVQYAQQMELYLGRRFYVPLLRMNIKTHQQTELLGAKFAH